MGVLLKSCCKLMAEPILDIVCNFYWKISAAHFVGFLSDSVSPTSIEYSNDAMRRIFLNYVEQFKKWAWSFSSIE